MTRLGEKFYEERRRQGFSLDDVEKAIKIKTSFLSAIEQGEYQKLPSSTYAQGFVRNYGKFLGLPENEILAMFRREFDEDRVFKVLPEGLAKKEEFPIKRIKFTQSLKIIFLLIIVLVGYILFQYRSAFIKPSLNVSTPKENSKVFSQTIEVSGKTDSNVTVFINNEAASLDSDGNFKKTITVFSGKSIIVIKAVNKFGKENVIERQVEVK